MTKQVKSKKRVAEHGEVFTNEREVKAMCDLVADECLRIDSRFLEPACGDGNFLSEILTRKLDVVTKKYKRSSYDYERNSLLAISSLYGIEIQVDNVKLCRKRLYDIWERYYKKSIKKAEQNDEICKSIKFILERNIVCGDALDFRTVDNSGKKTDELIVFSQWSFATGPMIKREDYVFEQLVNQDNESKENEQLDILANEDNEGTLVQIYPPMHYRRLYEYE
nr:DNA methyltransferase [uncultured Ruminococcus sp.]